MNRGSDIKLLRTPASAQRTKTQEKVSRKRKRERERAAYISDKGHPSRLRHIVKRPDRARPLKDTPQLIETRLELHQSRQFSIENKRGAMRDKK